MQEKKDATFEDSLVTDKWKVVHKKNINTLMIGKYK